MLDYGRFSNQPFNFTFLINYCNNTWLDFFLMQNINLYFSGTVGEHNASKIEVNVFFLSSKFIKNARRL